MGAKTIGLGLRNARAIALPAFIGSRADSRPMVLCMFDQIESAGLGRASELAAAYDGRTDAAVASFCAELPFEVGDSCGVAGATQRGTTTKTL